MDSKNLYPTSVGITNSLGKGTSRRSVLNTEISNILYPVIDRRINDDRDVLKNSGLEIKKIKIKLHITSLSPRSTRTKIR